MPAEQFISNKRFPAVNSLGLLLLFGYFCARQPRLTTESIIFWPGAYFLSLWLLSPLTRYFFHAATPLTRARFVRYHLRNSLLFGLLHFATTGLLILLLERLFHFPEHYTLSTLWVYARQSWHYGADGVLWYWGYTVLFLLVVFRKRWKEEEQKTADMKRELLDSDLHRLRVELNPHFLFNTMNSIAMKVRLKENKLAVAMIASLNDLLRVVLSRRTERTVTLKEELQLLNKYILIEKTRFGDELDIVIEAPEDVQLAQVPQLLLQPLVENAFKHGVRENLGQQRIQLTSVRAGDSLVITVYNTTREGNGGAARSSMGIGLQNIVRRLQKLYGPAFYFQRLDLDDGIAFKITLPYRTT